MTNKLIVTHANPDLDAVSAVWLIKRFWNEWEHAELAFVPAGETIESFHKKQGKELTGRLLSSEIVHVDTGMGEFDHHQDNQDTSAARLIFDHMVKNQRPETRDQGQEKEIKRFHKEALERLVRVVNDIDHFRQVYYPNPTTDYYQFLLVDILDGLNLLYNESGNGDIQVVEEGMSALDGIYRVMQNKVHAEAEIAGSEKVEETTKAGKVVGFATGNDAVLDMAQKMGYAIVVRKDPKKGYVRIKALPEKGIDLTNTYELLKKEDPHATWFLHSSKAMILNGSTKNPTMRPTALTLETIINCITRSVSH